MTNAKRYSILDESVREIAENAAVAQSVERRIGSAEVTGPIPVSSSEYGRHKGLSKGFDFERSLFLCYKPVNSGVYRFFVVNLL